MNIFIKIKRQLKSMPVLQLNFQKITLAFQNKKNICLNQVNYHYRVNNIKLHTDIYQNLQNYNRALKFLSFLVKLVLERMTLSKRYVIIHWQVQLNHKIIYSFLKILLCVWISNSNIQLPNKFTKKFYQSIQKMLNV